ncbi:MAG: glycosyltransferase N-terminal domain-containing protein [Candidatus Omnitrophota bacterium]
MWKLFFIIYDILFLIGFVIYLPVCFARGKINLRALKQKFGFIGQSSVRNCIWIQAVSVGEVLLIESLLKKLKETFDYPIVVSTTTLTGNRLAVEKYSLLAKVIFFPIDISIIIDSVVNKINPKIFISIETEIWPNLFYRLRKKKVPVIILNGRISDKAFPKYLRLKFFIGKILSLCNCISAQSLSQRDKFISLGCPEETVTAGGNMKFNSISVDESRLLTIKNSYLKLLKPGNHLLLIAASTHHNEEELLLEIYADICKKNIPLTLLIAPRHLERIPLIEQSIRAKGFTPQKITTGADNLYGGSSDVYILDAIGQLLYLYSLADICFVGGSMVNLGGHNILEPLYFLKPTCFGPHMHNFREIADMVISKGAAIKANDFNELKETITQLATDEEQRSRLRLNSLDVFEGSKKALDNNLRIILNYAP